MKDPTPIPDSVIRKRRKAPIVSPIVEEASLLNTVLLLGEEAENLVPMHYLFDAFVDILPSADEGISNFISLGRMGYKELFKRQVARIKDFFQNVEVLGTVGTETISVPIGEIHRPKIEGCTATYQQKYSNKSDYSVTVKILGIGGGANKSTKYGFEDTVETTDDCLQFVVPVTITWEECRNRDYVIFYRATAESFGEDYREQLLSGSSDQCGIAMTKVQAMGWQTHPFEIPKGTTRQRTLSFEKGHGAELSLQTNIKGVELGPKVEVSYLKETKCSYKLVGKHKYTAYHPKNALGYYWNYS